VGVDADASPPAGGGDDLGETLGPCDVGWRRLSASETCSFAGRNANHNSQKPAKKQVVMATHFKIPRVR
jgi:hypothetical protein